VVAQLTDEIQFELYNQSLAAITPTTSLETLHYATNILGTLQFEGQSQLFGPKLT
jgi:hypothetical protein